MPRPNDSPEVQASKTLAYILRHGAEKESLHIRSDGYIRLNDVLARPKMRCIDREMVLRLVADNAKQRFELFYGYDPSPPRPAKSKTKIKGKGKGNGQGKGKVDATHAQGQGKGERSDTGQGPDGDKHDIPAKTTNPTTNMENGQGDGQIIDAGEIDNIRNVLATTALESELPTELPLVSIPIPNDPPQSDSPTETIALGITQHSLTGEYFIRATQGHSLKLESTAHLEPVYDDEDGRARVGLLVHGTKSELYDTLKAEGLSRMARTHIHLAPALTNHRIVPRPNSTLRIYLDLTKLLQEGILVFTSLNGVVLTPGNADGVVKAGLWKKVERKVNGEWVVVE